MDGAFDAPRRPAARAAAGKFRPAHVAPARRRLNVVELAARSRRNALETLPAAAYTQPIVSGRTVRPWHVVSAPEGVRRVLLDRVEDYPKSQLTQRLLRPAVGDSIFSSEGDAWRWQRRAAAPSFSPRSLEAVAPMMTEAGARLRVRLEHVADAGFRGAGVACVMEEMITATFEVVCDALLAAGRADPGAGGDQLGLDRSAVGRQIARYLETIGRVDLLDLLGAPDWAPRPATLLHGNVLEETVVAVDRMIARRRKELDADPSGPDLVASLINAEDPVTGRRMDDATIRNNLMSFIVAGHETTALALAWALYLLANDPDAQDRAAAEAQAALGDRAAVAADAPSLTFVGRVIDEALRLFPPAAVLSRQAARADRICGRAVAPGDVVVVPIYAIHRHAALWEDPMAFDPERFAPEAAQKRDRFAYLPFGAGPRVCIGARFALIEAQILLATLLAGVRVAPRDARPPRPVMTLTLRPEGGMPLKILRRSGASAAP